MITPDILMAAGGYAADGSQEYINDVFSTDTYTGTGAALSINNGLDLDTKGGLIWIKNRSAPSNHGLYDTIRGTASDLATNSVAAATTPSNALTSFSSTGFNLSTLAKLNTNVSKYVSWSFRKAPKFFDMVTYTGNGASSRNFSHALAITPGMIIIKAISATGGWYVYHKDTTNANWYVRLESTSAQIGNSSVYPLTPTVTEFTVGTTLNANGVTYIAYIFADDPSTNGYIKCGSFLGTASNLATVDLGFEPQFLLVKCITLADNWEIHDSTRGYPGYLLRANTGDFDTVSNTDTATSTGFSISPAPANSKFIYLAIRRPNKPPTIGTEVFNTAVYSGNAGTNIITVPSSMRAPDVFWSKYRTGTPGNTSNTIWDKLRTKDRVLFSDQTVAETTTGVGLEGFDMSGVTLNTSYQNTSGATYVGWFFKRAPGVFDEVCYAGNGTTQQITHNLGATPELMIIKSRNFAAHWGIYHAGIGINHVLFMLDWQKTPSGADWWGNNTVTVAPTSTTFTVGSNGTLNTLGSGGLHVAYLFASKAGISKVFSYTGNGTSQTINCGFATGARFVLVKRTDNLGNWYVWDSTRGIVAANDPYLIWNTTAAEVATDDSIDPNTTGFIVNQAAATNINVTSATYVGLAIA